MGIALPGMLGYILIEELTVPTDDGYHASSLSWGKVQVDDPVLQDKKLDSFNKVAPTFWQGGILLNYCPVGLRSDQ